MRGNRHNQRFAKKLGGFWEFSGRNLGIAGNNPSQLVPALSQKFPALSQFSYSLTQLG